MTDMLRFTHIYTLKHTHTHLNTHTLQVRAHAAAALRAVGRSWSAYDDTATDVGGDCGGGFIVVLEAALEADR